MYKPLKIENVIDLKKFEDQTDALTAFIAYLEAITAPAHSAEGHSFTDPENRGICTVCGWVHPEVPHVCGNHTLVHHLEGMLQQAKKIRDGKGAPDLEITVVLVRDTKPRPHWWSLFN